MPNAAACRRVRQQIDDGAVFIGDRNPRLTAPDRLDAKKRILGDVSERERHALHRLFLVAKRPGGEHEDTAEKLFRKVPVFGGRPAPDIARRK